MNAVDNLSPLDGRYRRSSQALAKHCSEAGLIRARARVEIAWLLALAHHQVLPAIVALEGEDIKLLESWASHFTDDDVQAVKDKEAETNHDVKALEYVLQAKCRASHRPNLIRAIPAIHFACTSEDINNLSVNLQTKSALEECLIPAMDEVIAHLTTMVIAQASIPMLARTHGQPATPVTLGKEMAVFVDRLRRVRDAIGAIALTGKMNGATGGFNAHLIAVPKADWQAITDGVIRQLGFEPNHFTTQIEPHDRLAELFLQLTLIHTIAIDLARDIWQYIAMDYFTLKVLGQEVGSSTMPHKVNPIDFENAEGNFGLANALLTHMAHKLPISRLQRDLTDSTVQRNIGSAFGYALLAWNSLAKGLGKLSPNPDKMHADLMSNWEVLTEAVQTVLRAEGHENAYDLLKAASRGKRINAEAYQQLLRNLPLTESSRIRLQALTPPEYIGMSEQVSHSLLRNSI